MARYYEENALIEFVKQYTPTINGETTMECVERAIREAPTADVVPKSEVDRLEYTLTGVMHSVDKWLDGEELKQDEVNRAITMREKTLRIIEELALKNHQLKEENEYLQSVVDGLDDFVLQVKQEVASEIFEEIEAVLNKIFEEYAVLGQADCCMITEIIRRKLSAELKKKYTESEGNI